MSFVNRLGKILLGGALGAVLVASVAAEPHEPLRRGSFIKDDSGEAGRTPDASTILVNSRRIRLNYEIREVGPSGVSSVELWATCDAGRTWQHYSDEPPPVGPLVVHVAKEGKYGFTLVAKNGVGMSRRRPVNGDAPQIWVEVDETRPVVKLSEVQVGTGGEQGLMTIRWSAMDANLPSHPVSISMSVSKDGPWTPIASGLDNTGYHVWKMPRDVPYKFHVRVEAADRAGNVGNDVTARPVAVDNSLPQGVILGVDRDRKDNEISR